MTIGVFSSGGVIQDREAAEGAIQQLKEQGYKIRQTPSLFGSDGLFPADGETLAGEFMELYLDSGVDALLALKGGYGTARLLSHLDYKVIGEKPKKVCGYSDLTVLVSAFVDKSGLEALHGPMIVSMDEEMTDRSYSQLLNRLGESFGREDEDFFGGYGNHDEEGPLVLSPGKAVGLLKGGNLCVLTTLLGTDFEPDFEGAILLLEDVNEEPYCIHRMMNHLKMCGALDRAVGFIVGRFTGCAQPEGEKRFQPSIRAVMEEYLIPTGKPVLYNVPVGHIDDNMTVIMGKPLSMDLSESGWQLRYLSKGVLLG